jgi:tRNA G37 N-methylase TrmD
MPLASVAPKGTPFNKSEAFGMGPPRLLTAMVHWAIANWAPNEKMTKTKRERLQLAAMVVLRQFAPEFFIKAKIKI